MALALCASGLLAATWNVLEHGVVGDGATKERNAIQAVIDMAAAAGGGTVYFPSRPAGQYYCIDVPAGQTFYPLFMRDNVILQGDGAQSNSLLKNPAVTTQFGRTFVFIWGTAFPTRWVEGRAWPVGNVAVNATSVTLQNPAQISNFAVGDKIRVADPNYVVYANNQKHELYAQLFRVMAVDPGTGTIQLSHAFRRAIVGAVVHKIEDCTDSTLRITTGFGTYRGGLKGLRLESNFRVSARGGAIDCTLSDLDVQGFSGVLYGNSWNECTFDNITERVKAGMELSDCCVGNMITRLTQTYYNQSDWDTNAMFAGIQEYSSFNTISHFVYNLGDEVLPNGAIRTIEGTGNVFEHGTIDARSLPLGTSRILKPFGLATRLTDIDIICRNPAFYVECGDGPGHRVEDIRIDDDYDGASTGKIEISATGSTFKDIVQPRGTFHFASTANNNAVIGHSRPAAVDDDGTNNTVSLAETPLFPALGSSLPEHAVSPADACNLGVTAGTGATVQWSRNGLELSGATQSTLLLTNLQPVTTGVYAATVTPTSGPAIGSVAIVGLSSTSKVLGSGEEIGWNIQHPNGQVYDQVLLQGLAATITADAGQVTRISYLDLNDDIVQVEFSGPGSLSLVLADCSGPAAPAKYNQDVSYMKGHAGIVITGATEFTNVSVFSVGRMTAVNQALFKTGTSYDGMADLAFIAIASANGKFGGVRTANASYWASRGLTGLYAPGVEFVGPVFIGEIAAVDGALPVLMGGQIGDARITGGRLRQDNSRAVQVSGLTRLQFAAGTDSHGNLQPAQVNQAVLQQDGRDVTAAIVANPGN